MTNYKHKELAIMKEKYDRREYDHLKPDIERFIITHKGDIIRLQKKMKVEIEYAIKYYILIHRSINPIKEITDQLHEINKEKWIQGIHLGRSPDEEKVAREWAEKYGPGWRRYRATEYVFIIEQEKERYLKLFDTDLKHL